MSACEFILCMVESQELVLYVSVSPCLCCVITVFMCNSAIRMI